jgi:hypothetical protein
MSNINSIYNLNGVPLFTYGMIGVTTIVLAIITMMDTDNDSFAKDEGYEKSQTESSDSMLSNIVGESKEEKNDESVLANKVEEKNNESILENIVGESKEEKKEGGKYGRRKTKHNKRQNTYTRKR